MRPFDDDELLSLDLFDSEAANVLVEATRLAVAPPTRSLRCQPGHLLLAMWPVLSERDEWRAAMDVGLAAGCQLAELPSLIESYVSDTAHEQFFELNQSDFDPHVLDALKSCDRVENERGETIWDAAGQPVGVLPLLIAVLRNPNGNDQEAFRGIADFSKCAAALARLLTGDDGVSELPPLFASDGTLELEQFDDNSYAILEAARHSAGQLGADRIRPTHLLLALLDWPDGVTDEVMRLQLGLGAGPQTVSDALKRSISRPSSGENRNLLLDKMHLSETMQRVLGMAQGIAFKKDATSISERFLLRAVIEVERDSVAGQFLCSSEVGLNLDTLIRDIDHRISDYRRGKGEETPPPMLICAGRSEDLTWLARESQLSASVGQDELIESMLRGLHKRQENHVLVTGEPGVGKTQLVRELGRRVGVGLIPFLERKKVLRVNCDGVPPEQSREWLAEILSSIKGRKDIILCLDHFDAVIRYDGARESHNRDMLRVALKGGDLHLIGVIENRYVSELLGHDQSFLDLFSRVDVGEIDVEQSISLIEQTTAVDLERLYDVQIEAAAIRRASFGSSEFIMSQRLPLKAIRALRDACEWLSYERELGRDSDGIVTEQEVIRALSQRTGIDEETISGTGSRMNFRDELAKSVVGQQQAVHAVGDRLTRIKAGASREGKPAAVFLFAGLTGTGKTELAKAVARVYSASRKLSVYSMTRFTQPHSIQGLTGVPPGYVGYESGGRLINDLNSDPYGVILFDEAEKAHPDIWQSMLSLFDEAWIEDHRNVRAYGNRAIFILTSNAGQDFLRQHYRDMPAEELREQVSRRLVDYRNPDTGQRPFSPEFLGRFTDIVVFNPLSSNAMHDIARLNVDQLKVQWLVKRGMKVRVDTDVVTRIASLSHAENDRFDGTKGGRIVSRWVATMVEDPLLKMLIDHPDEFRSARGLRVVLTKDDRSIVELDQEPHP